MRARGFIHCSQAPQSPKRSVPIPATTRPFLRTARPAVLLWLGILRRSRCKRLHASNSLTHDQRVYVGGAHAYVYTRVPLPQEYILPSIAPNAISSEDRQNVPKCVAERHMESLRRLEPNAKTRA